MFKAVLQKGQWLAEKGSRWSETVGRSSISWSTAIEHSSLDGSSTLNALGW